MSQSNNNNENKKNAGGTTPGTTGTAGAPPAHGEHKGDTKGGKEGGKGGNHGAHHTQAPTKNNVTALPGMCLSEGCKKKAEKANFCMEHFDWFKEGLVTKEGRKPTDFEKKFFDYTRRKNKHVA